MILLTALVLAQATPVSIPNLPRPRPRPMPALTVTASVEVLRAERVGDRGPGALLRGYRRDARGVVVDFN